MKYSINKIDKKTIDIELLVSEIKEVNESAKINLQGKSQKIDALDPDNMPEIYTQDGDEIFVPGYLIY